MAALHLYGAPDGARNPDRFPSSLRLLRPYLHLPARRPSRRLDTTFLRNLQPSTIIRRTYSWIQKQQNSSALGLACSALIGAGVGIGLIFGNFLQGALRNPSAAPAQFPNLLLGFALAEATGLFGLVIALILLFVKL